MSVFHCSPVHHRCVSGMYYLYINTFVCETIVFLSSYLLLSSVLYLSYIVLNYYTNFYKEVSEFLVSDIVWLNIVLICNYYFL